MFRIAVTVADSVKLQIHFMLDILTVATKNVSVENSVSLQLIKRKVIRYFFIIKKTPKP